MRPLLLVASGLVLLAPQAAALAVLVPEEPLASVADAEGTAEVALRIRTGAATERLQLAVSPAVPGWVQAGGGPRVPLAEGWVEVPLPAERPCWHGWCDVVEVSLGVQGVPPRTERTLLVAVVELDRPAAGFEVAWHVRGAPEPQPADPLLLVAGAPREEGAAFPVPGPEAGVAAAALALAAVAARRRGAG